MPIAMQYTIDSVVAETRQCDDSLTELALLWNQLSSGELYNVNLLLALVSSHLVGQFESESESQGWRH